MAEWQKMTGSGGAGVLLTLISLWFFGKSSDSYRADFYEKRSGVLQTSLDKESQERKAAEIGWEKTKEKEIQIKVREDLVKERETSLEARKQEAQKILDGAQTNRDEARIIRDLVEKFAPEWKAEAVKFVNKLNATENERDELRKKCEGLQNELKKLKGEKL